MEGLHQSASAGRDEVLEALHDWCNPDDIDVWLDSPCSQLGGEIPNDVIASGRGDDVMAVIQNLLVKLRSAGMIR